MSDIDLPLAVRMMQDGYLMEIQDLKEKNEQLRELVRDMYEDTEGRCFECRSWEHFEHRGKPSECGNGDCSFKRIADRMRELGVDA